TQSGDIQVICGQNQSFLINADACFHIADVVVDGTSQGAVSSYIFINVQASHTITATFAQSGPFTLSASAGPNGSISPSGDLSVACGGGQVYTITPDPCYHVAGVTVDGSFVGTVTSYTFSNVTANHTIAATFAADVRTIMATAGSGGSINPSGSVS